MDYTLAGFTFHFNRHTLLSEFKDAMLQELLELEKDVIKVQEAEQKTMVRASIVILWMFLLNALFFH